MRWRVSDAHRSVGIGPTLGLRALQLYSYPPNTPACSLLSSRNTHQNHPCLEKKREARARMPFRVCGTCIVLCGALAEHFFTSSRVRRTRPHPCSPCCCCEDWLAEEASECCGGTVEKCVCEGTCTESGPVAGKNATRGLFYAVQRTKGRHWFLIPNLF